LMAAVSSTSAMNAFVARSRVVRDGSAKGAGDGGTIGVPSHLAAASQCAPIAWALGHSHSPVF